MSDVRVVIFVTSLVLVAFGGYRLGGLGGLCLAVGAFGLIALAAK